MYDVLLIYISDCGYRDSTLFEDRDVSQIVKGDLAKLGQFPWQFVLYRNNRFICGATLIDPWWLITAAHCV